MGFSPKILVALIALGLVATGSIVFNVYLLATRDKALTEVESLKDHKNKLESELRVKSSENDKLNYKLKSGGSKSTSQSSTAGEEELLRGGMRIHIMTPYLTMENMTLEVKSGDTVETVKRKIHEKGGVPPYQQSLRFGGNPLEDGLPLYHYKIEEGFFLYLELKPSGGSESTNQSPTPGGEEHLQRGIQISITTPIGMETIILNVKTEDTVYSVKQKIQDKVGIPPDQQRLILVFIQLEDYHTLSDCYISNGSTLRLELIPSGGSK